MDEMGSGETGIVRQFRHIFVDDLLDMGGEEGWAYPKTSRVGVTTVSRT